MSDMTVEKLQVILEANANPMREEMKKVKKDLEESTKVFREQNSKMQKQMDAIMAPIRKIREQMQKVHQAVQQACNVNPSRTGFKDMQSAIDATEKKIRDLIRRRDELEATGGDIEYTKEYKEMAQAVEMAEKKLNSLLARKEMIETTGGNMRGASWKNLQYQIEEADNSVKALKMDLANVSTAEKYQNTSEWTKLQRAIEQTRMELAQYNAQQYDYERGTKVSRVSKIFSSFGQVLKSVTSGIRKSGGAFAALIQRFRSGLPHINKTKNSMGGLGGTGKGLSKIFQTIGMSARFMFASFLIRGSIEGAKEGFKHLAQYSDETNKSISTLMSDLVTLKNAFAVAFAPILNVVTPYLDTFISYLVAASNAIGQFFASLTGSATWVKATKVQQDYAGSLKDTASAAAEAKREIYGFDEITKQSDSSSSAGSGTSIGDMFTTEEVSNSFANFAQMIKDAWANADFTGIGTLVGEKLKDELDKIDWDGIKEKCNKIAKSVGTFINGFLATDGLAESIGSTIGNAINTGVGMANTFFITTDFLALGDFIATAANEALDTADFNLLGETVANGIKSGIETWYGFVTTFNFSGLGTKIGTSLNSFFSRMNFKTMDGKTGKLLSGWQKIGISISKSFSGITSSFTEALKAVDWTEIGQGIVDFICAIDWKDLVWNLKTFGEAFGNALAEAYEGIIQGLLMKLGLSEEEAKKFQRGYTKNGKMYDMDGNEISNTRKKKSDTDKLDSVNKISDTNLTAGVMSDIQNPLNTFDVNVFQAQARATIGSALKPLDIKVTTSTKASDIYNTLQNAFEKRELHTASSLDTTGGEMNAKAQTEFAVNEMHTAAKIDNNGFILFDIIQNLFGKNSYHTGAKADNNGFNIWDIIQTAFGSKPVHTGAKTDTDGGILRQLLQNVFGAASLFTSVETTNDGNDLRTGLQSSFGSNVLTVGVSLVQQGWSTISGWLNSLFGNGGGTGAPARYNKKADGGIFSGGTWHSVAAYASGGTPTSAQFFMAREAGPELVGTIGNHTAVVNNDQIVSSVSNGVYTAVLSAMSQTNGNQSASVPAIYVYVGGEQVTDCVVKDINGRTLATGKCPILV